MLKPVQSPMSCFGLEHRPETARCKSCPHFDSCRTYMGIRLNRIPVSEAKFCLVPTDYVRKWEQPDEDIRDIKAIYSAVYRQVYGEDPIGYIGIDEDRVGLLAERAQCSVPTFILTCMFAHKQVYSGGFSPWMLTDNRALNRVCTYGEACRAKYGEFSVNSLDKVVDDDLVAYDLDERMLRSEIKAGNWIIEYKLETSGQPYLPMLMALENELDPAWLAIEHFYEPVIQDNSKTLDRPTEKEDTRHEAILLHKRLKKHKHQGIAHFRAREKIMPKAVLAVLEKHSFAPGDFEIKDEPVVNPLLFWNRLGTAIMHFECLKYVNGSAGLYSVL